jgi:hypothetical protein
MTPDTLDPARPSTPMMIMMIKTRMTVQVEILLERLASPAPKPKLLYEISGISCELSLI